MKQQQQQPTHSQLAEQVNLLINSVAVENVCILADLDIADRFLLKESSNSVLRCIELLLLKTSNVLIVLGFFIGIDFCSHWGY